VPPNLLAESQTRTRSPSPPRYTPGLSRSMRRRKNRRPGWFGHALLILPILAASGWLYLHLNKQVTLVVDGRAATVSTFAGSVGEFLEGRGVSLGPHDTVAPGADARVAEGMQIRVLHAKEIVVVLNGRSRTVYVRGSTVEDVLEHINVRLRQGDRVEPSRSARIEEGDVIVFREAVQVRLLIDRQDRRVITNAPSVAYLLDSMGVVLDGRDRVSPAADAELGSGMSIRVIRVEVRRITEQAEVPYGTRVVYSDQLLQGQRQVDRAGVPGLEELTLKVRLENGVEVFRDVLDRKRLRDPASQVLVIGTRAPDEQWGIASWYDWDGRAAPCGGTLSGFYAAHRTLPCGTRVTVYNPSNGSSVTVVIRDRGPWIGGRIIDLSDEAFSRIAPLGAGTVRVRITW
jgi:uncharacterized protein YabE (DUF348 family)